jgi:hypothetical protein
MQNGECKAKKERRPRLFFIFHSPDDGSPSWRVPFEENEPQDVSNTRCGTTP